MTFGFDITFQFRPLVPSKPSARLAKVKSEMADFESYDDVTGGASNLVRSATIGHTPSQAGLVPYTSPNGTVQIMLPANEEDPYGSELRTKNENLRMKEESLHRARSDEKFSL